MKDPIIHIYQLCFDTNSKTIEQNILSFHSNNETHKNEDLADTSKFWLHVVHISDRPPEIKILIKFQTPNVHNSNLHQQMGDRASDSIRKQLFFHAAKLIASKLFYRMLENVAHVRLLDLGNAKVFICENVVFFLMCFTFGFTLKCSDTIMHTNIRI